MVKHCAPETGFQVLYKLLDGCVQMKGSFWGFTMRNFEYICMQICRGYNSQVPDVFMSLHSLSDIIHLF